MVREFCIKRGCHKPPRHLRLNLARIPQAKGQMILQVIDRRKCFAKWGYIILLILEQLLLRPFLSFP
jgi:hypothetical protein